MDGVEYVPLQNSVTEWAGRCVTMANKWENVNRNDYSKLIEHGFSIKTEANRLQKYYLGLE